MLMKDNKKGMAAIIMGKLNGKSEAPKMSEDMAPEDDSVALKTAAEEFINAVHSKSPMSVVESLKSLMELCESEGPEVEIEEKQS